MGLVRPFIGAALLAAACSEESINPLDLPDPPLPPCGGGGDPGGVWDPLVHDWSDVGVPGVDPPMDGECLDEDGDPEPIFSHHQSLSPVHAIHMPTPPAGELLMYHGWGEERVWPIGADAVEMRRHPIPQCVPVHRPSSCLIEDGDPSGVCEEGGGVCVDDSDCPLVVVNEYPQIFCGAHGLLPTGDVFVAGGNVTGGPGGGGLYESFLFDPREADPFAQPYGWTRVGVEGGASEDMEVDRWYPTVIGLPDGRVLIAGGASRVPGGQNTFEVFDPTAPEGEQIEKLPDALDFDAQANEHMPTYPFMFVLPNGDVLYAGGEGAEPLAFDGRVLVPSYGGALSDWQWASYTANSTIAGGSAVMYRPGKVMKSGGVGGGNGPVANNVTEILDLSTYDSNDYTSAPTWFTRRAEIPGAMHRPRHFHTLTVLPDGRVLATGGNMRGNDGAGEDALNGCENGPVRILDYPCEETCPSLCRLEDEQCSVYALIECGSDSDCPGGATCDAGNRCAKSCTSDDDCPSIANEPAVCWEEATCPASEDTEVCSPSPDLRCNPANNACFATTEAEIWNPECETWSQYGPQMRPRMYHSIAMLIPDGRVLSAGGGHVRGGQVDQTNSEYFEPIYGDGGGEVPQVVVVDDDIDNAEDYTVHVPYGPGEITVELLNDAAQDVQAVTLVRLGSVTHQFDMGQRFLELGFQHEPDGELMTVLGPESLDGNAMQSAVAPPGYYMMFVWGDDTPSVGQYVHLGAPAMSAMWSAPAGSELQAIERSCLAEPLEGVCPSDAEEKTVVALPKADGPSGVVDGWNILVPAGLVRDPDAPTAAELEAVKARAVAACRAHWGNEPSIEVNCEDVGAFETPVEFLRSSEGALDLVLPTRQDGSGIFDGEKLETCQLGLDCCSEFDESICDAAPSRTTTAETPLGGGEEYRVALDTRHSRVEIVTDIGTYSSPLTGAVGYSFCTADEEQTCPFYVGSLEARATTRISASLRCADGTSSRQTIDNLSMSLAQPAFGIAAKGSTKVGFPTGALVFDSSLDVGGSHHARRRPNGADVVVEAEGASFAAGGLTTTVTVPCNDSHATVKVNYTLTDEGENQPLAGPPRVTIDVPDVVTCGKEITLAASVEDRDDDVDTVRWYVDDVLLAPSVAAMTFTKPHTLRVVVRDQRGATTSSAKVVACD